MSKRQAAPTSLQDLESTERSIVLSFLALSERTTEADRTPMDELALSVAMKASFTSTPN